MKCWRQSSSTIMFDLFSVKNRTICFKLLKCTHISCNLLVNSKSMENKNWWSNVNKKSLVSDYWRTYVFKLTIFLYIQLTLKVKNLLSIIFLTVYSAFGNFQSNLKEWDCWPAFIGISVVYCYHKYVYVRRGVPSFKISISKWPLGNIRTEKPYGNYQWCVIGVFTIGLWWIFRRKDIDACGVFLRAKQCAQCKHCSPLMYVQFSQWLLLLCCRLCFPYADAIV